MPEIRVDIDDRAVQAAMKDLAGKVKNPAPVMKIIGEYLLRSTEDRFHRQGPSPDGTPWAPLKKSTLKHKKHTKILTESGHLRGSIRYQVEGTNAVAIGTNKVYGAIHQLGGTIRQAARSDAFVRNRYSRGAKKGSFKKGSTAGRGYTFGERNIGIPARPYLGVSVADSAQIVEMINRYLAMR
jgi:phage virion morphogenesis protein